MKFALKLPQVSRSWLMLAGAIALGIVATALTHKFLKDYIAQLEQGAHPPEHLVMVVVAKEDLPRGTRIDGKLFRPTKMPAAYVHASAIDPRHFSQYVGQRLGAPLKRGEVVLEVHMESANPVFSNTLENGNRALTTEVDEVNSISGMLRPTDHIDLMVTARGANSSTTETTFPLLTNVEVLATGQVTRKRDGSDRSRTYTTITLSVSPEDAERIVVAKNSGKLTAVLRNPDDNKENAIAAMNIDDLMPKKPKGTRSPEVQYIVGNHS
jgi:pilus assembly protein CpaB